MYGFFIDKRGGEGDEEVCDWDEIDEIKDPSEHEKIELPVLMNDRKTKSNKTNHDKIKLNDTYLITNYAISNEKACSSSGISKILQKSVVTPGMEQQLTIGPIKSNRSLKLQKKKLRDITKGKKWFDIPATEVTQEIKNDLQILQMRRVLDRKHVYKKNDMKLLPKYFQVGTVIESPADFYNGRIVKSQRKKTLVDELLADAECKTYQRKKYREIIGSKLKKKSGGKNPARSAETNKKPKIKK